jgi:hypothetical protein
MKADEGATCGSGQDRSHGKTNNVRRASVPDAPARETPAVSTCAEGVSKGSGGPVKNSVVGTGSVLTDSGRPRVRGLVCLVTLQVLA